MTERKQAEQALRAAEERFRRAFEDAPIGMAIVAASPDRLGRFLDVNRAMCDLSGYDRDLLLEMTLQSLIHPLAREGDIEIIGRLLGGQLDRYQGETRYVNAAGDPAFPNRKPSRSTSPAARWEIRSLPPTSARSSPRPAPTRAD